MHEDYGYGFDLYNDEPAKPTYSTQYREEKVEYLLLIIAYIATACALIYACWIYG